MVAHFVRYQFYAAVIQHLFDGVCLLSMKRVLGPYEKSDFILSWFLCVSKRQPLSLVRFISSALISSQLY